MAVFLSLLLTPPPSFSLYDLVCGQEPKTKVTQILQSVVVASYFDKKGELCYSDHFLLLTDSCIIYTEDKTGWKELCTW